MQKRKLGNLEVSAIGLGCMARTSEAGTPAEASQLGDPPFNETERS
jgi:aryl-alcohol dehydrogenase-like predicted oxidoreductase